MRLAQTSNLPPPIDFGAPPKFTKWRAEQVDAILRASDFGGRCSCYNMPTGSGKSITAVMLGRVLGLRTLILTATKALQDQYHLRDTLTDADVRGQQNYECLAVRRDGPLRDYAHRRYRTMVDKAPCHVGVSCWMKNGGCTYYDALRFARQQQVVIANYDLWLSIGKGITAKRGEEALGKFDLLVLDEAHAAVDKTCGALRVELPKAELYGMLNVNPLELDAPIEDWRRWGHVVLQKWGDEMDRLALTMKGQYVDQSVVEEWRLMQRLGQGLEEVAQLNGDWVVGENWKGEKITFDPVWPTGYTERLLFRQTPRVLMLSATVNEQTLDLLGVGKDEREYVEYPSTFPVERRPVYVLTGPRELVPAVDYRMSEESERLWVQLIDLFIGPRLELGRKGIIHCVSYARMKRIKMLSRYRELFVVNEDSSETGAAIKRYRESGEPVVLLSPSVTTGEDFPDDECRWIVVPKLPFPDTRDPVAKRREQSYKGYGGWQMMTTLCQSIGRGDRNQYDWCEGIVLDGHAKWALPANKQHAPKYFVDSWQWVYSLPSPLEV